MRQRHWKIDITLYEVQIENISSKTSNPYQEIKESSQLA